jgi:regulator of replication initiation timing
MQELTAQVASLEEEVELLAEENTALAAETKAMKGPLPSAVPSEIRLQLVEVLGSDV